MNKITKSSGCVFNDLDIDSPRTIPTPCDELVTVGHLWEYAEYYRDDRGWYGYVKVITEENPAHHVTPIEKVRNHDELVTRQNAEEVIAAKDARIAELEEHFAEMTRSCLAERDRNKAIEADNKRLRDALVPFADVADLDIGDDEDDMAVFWPISNERFSLARRLRVGDLRRASEALGEEKP